MKYLTTKCYKYGHPEFELHADDSLLRSDLDWFGKSIESSVAAGSKFEVGQTVSLGWSLLRVDSSENDYLTMFEPDFETMPIEWKSGITNSLHQYRSQCDVAASLKLDTKIDFPSIRDSLIVGKDLEEETSGFVLERAESEEDSGWFVGDYNTILDYSNPENLTRISLYELAVKFESIIKFVALPAGVRIDLTRTTIHVSVNGQPCPISTGSFLSELCLQNAIRIL